MNHHFTELWKPRYFLTEEQQKKIQEYLETKGPTICPAVGSKEFAELMIAQEKKWRASVAESTLRGLGLMFERKNRSHADETPAEKKKRLRAEWKAAYHKRRVRQC